jgi:poly-gamma-glutamate synthesis protein (capsule biosynthesis protein)
MKYQKKIIFGLSIFCLLIVLSIYNQKRNSSMVRIGLGGDTMLGRLVNVTIGERGYFYPWGTIVPLLESTDLNLVNLETTLTTSTDIVPKTFNFKADPDKVQTLKSGNIHAVNIANNHILDFGQAGLIETIQTLDNAGIGHVGAGNNIQEAKQPIIFEKNGIRIGIIGYADYPQEWAATDTNPGINYVQIGDINTIKKDIADIRKKVDLLILSIHWGPNMRQRPTQEFRDFAHAIIDAGVDIFHGHSAHVFQGVEQYNNGVILYDTGDFVDDYAVTQSLRTDWALFFEITVEKQKTKAKIMQLKLVPLFISNMQVNKAEGLTAAKILEKIRLLSQEFNTVINEQGILNF